MFTKSRKAPKNSLPKSKSITSVLPLTGPPMMATPDDMMDAHMWFISSSVAIAELYLPHLPEFLAGILSAPVAITDMPALEYLIAASISCPISLSL